MRLTKGAITNLIANYKSVLTKMFTHNRFVCKKHAAALLACLIMATAAPAMGATDYEVNGGTSSGGVKTEKDTLEILSDDIAGVLVDGDTVEFVTDADVLQPLETAFEISTSLGTVAIEFANSLTNGITISKAEVNGANSFIVVTGSNKFTLTVSGSEGITISGFTDSAINSADDVDIDSTGSSLTFSGNSATVGGSIAGGGTAAGGAISGDNVEILDGTNTFSGNTTTVSGTDNAYGGAIYGDSSVTITNGTNIFDNNSVTADTASGGNAYGGAIMSGGTVNIDTNASTNTFTGNSAGTGGAIYATGDVTIDNGATVKFYGNTSTDDGNQSSAIYSGNDIVLTGNSTLRGEGGFTASNEILFDNSIIFLENANGGAGTIELNGTIATFDDMTIKGSGELKGSAITVGGSGLEVETANAGDSIVISSNLDVNSQTLTKTGLGTLTLADETNTYTGIIDNQAGTLNIAAMEYDDQNIIPTTLALATVTNDARLNFITTDGSYYKKAITINDYTGTNTETIGLQTSFASSDPTKNWSDHVAFTTFANDGSTAVHLDLAPGSSPKNLAANPIEFAEIDSGSTFDENTFTLDSASSRLGAYKLGVAYDIDGVTSNGIYSFIANFDAPSSKVYSETAAAGLAQAASMHGRLLFNATGEAARDAAENNTTGVFAGYERVDSRFETGSHADVTGNNFAVALGFKANEKTTWGVFGQMFKGDYDTDTGNEINSSGDLNAHDFGLFVEYRPAGQSETGAGRYYKGIVRAGRTSSDFRANNGWNGSYSTFSMGRNVFGMSFGGGYVKAMNQDRTADIYTHLIYTGLSSNTTTDSIGQEINFGSSNSFRLLTGARLNFNQNKKTGAYLGAALDYEFSGKTDTYIDGFRAEQADIKGLTGILELGLITKPNATTAINLGLQGYVGKKQGLGGTLTFNKLF